MYWLNFGSVFWLKCTLSSPTPQGPEWGVVRRQGEAPGASAPPALVHPEAERGAGWGPSLDSTAHYSARDWHAGGENTHANCTYSSFYTHLSPSHKYFGVFQGCVGCSTVTAAAHSPLPPAPDSSCPPDSPEQDSIGPVVDTWDTPKPKELTTPPTAKPAMPEILPTPAAHLLLTNVKNGSLFMCKVVL